MKIRWFHETIPLNHYMAAFMKISRMNPEIFAGEIVKSQFLSVKSQLHHHFPWNSRAKKRFIFRINYRCGFCWLIHHVLVKSHCDGEPQKNRIQYVINQHFPTEIPRFFRVARGSRRLARQLDPRRHVVEGGGTRRKWAVWERGPQTWCVLVYTSHEYYSYKL